MIGETNIFTAINVPRQRPLVLLVKVSWIEGKTFESGEGRKMKSGARREVDQCQIVLD